MYLLVLQRLFLELILDIIYFPIWWYTSGLKHAWVFCWHLLEDGNAVLAPGLWLKNIFVPMFGQSDFQGRLVSFFMRLINVLARGFVLLLYLVLLLFLFLLWIIIPIIVVYLFFRSFINY